MDVDGREIMGGKLVRISANEVKGGRSFLANELLLAFQNSHFCLDSPKGQCENNHGGSP